MAFVPVIPPVPGAYPKTFVPKIPPVPGAYPKPKPKPRSRPNNDPATSPGDINTMWGPTNTFTYGDTVEGSQTIDQGWDATGANLQEPRRSLALNQANALITDGTGTGSFQLPIFVTNLSMDSSLAGSTAQSQKVQDFYPHNFVAPTIRLSGWSLDQADYGLLCEFIHSAQRKALTSSKPWPAFMTQICVFGRRGQPTDNSLSTSWVPGTPRGVDGTRQGQDIENVYISQPKTLMRDYPSDPPTAPPGTYYNQTMHGAHQTIVAKGYIHSIPRLHQVGQYAVQWEFDFVVAAMLRGIYQDTVSYGTVLKTWRDVLKDAQSDLVTPPTAAENKAALAYALANEGTLVHPSGDGGATGLSGGGGPSTPGNSGTAGGSSGAVQADKQITSPRTLDGVAQAAVIAAKMQSQFHNWHYNNQSGRTNDGNGLFDPPHTFDCSGFTEACYKAAGMPDPSPGSNWAGNSNSIMSNSTKIDARSAVPGDVLIWGDHITVYVGGGQNVSMGAEGDPTQGPTSADINGISNFIGYFHVNGG